MSYDPASFAYKPGTGEMRHTPAPSKAVRRAIEDDRKWFLKHPSRTVRLRDPAPGEAAALAAPFGDDIPTEAQGYALRIAVTRGAPGVRYRQPVWTRLDSKAPEEAVIAMLKLIDAMREQGVSGEIFAADLMAAMGDPAIKRH